MTEPAPRIAPPPPEDWGDAILDALLEGRDSLMAGPMKEALGERDLGRLAAMLPYAVTTTLHHPRLTGRFLAYNGVLLNDPCLPARWRELLVLRVAWRTRSRYEWLQHVRMAPRYGLDESAIRAIADGGGEWVAPEADLLAAADQLLDSYRIEDATWSRLSEHLDVRQLIEVPYVVGTYTCLAMAFKSFGLPLDAGLLQVDPVAEMKEDP